MDTKSKKIKYSFFTKLICWLMAILMFCLTFLIALKVVVGVYFFGVENLFDKKESAFLKTEPITYRLQRDVDNAFLTGTQSTLVYKTAFANQKDEIVKDIVNKFYSDKSEIIKSELEFAVNDYQGGYYPETDVVNEVDENGGVYESTVYIPEDKAIKEAQAALSTAKGTDFLKYEYLVRSNAFDGYGTYEYTVTVKENADEHSYSYAFDIPYTTKDVQSFVETEYEGYAAETISGFTTSDEALRQLEKLVNFKYYIENFDGDVYSNISSIPKDLSTRNNYILCNGKEVKTVGFEGVLISEKMPCKKLCVYLDENFKGDDVYGNLYKTYNALYSADFNVTLICFAVALLLCIIMTVIWLRLCGHKSGTDKVEIAPIDKIPNDIHFIVTFGLISISVICGLLFASESFYDVFYKSKTVLAVLTVVVAVVGMLLTEWLSSVVRIAKSDKSFFKNITVVYIFKAFSKLFSKIKCELCYKPKKMRKRTLICFAVYLLFNLILLTLTVLFIYTGCIPIGIILFIWDLVFNVFAIYEFSTFINQLDAVIDASSKGENIDFENKKVSEPIKILADNISNNNDRLNEAITDAVKKEQMKTQLITNVSHDLKTPLTSLISYSDLLTKCNIEDEDAKKYISVINQQSDKLKRLIEDLIEASKVSTGNVVLNKTKLNLSELAVQALGEFTPEFEKNGNELKSSEPETPPTVFADGTKTYRVLSNLLNNAKKYSAPGTRIYASVFAENGYGCFELKNISKDSLNISASELTERFVRGDESRTREGNGLGLSIAKDLCTIQDGVLDITIDGDLFKVVVRLPLDEPKMQTE